MSNKKKIVFHRLDSYSITSTIKEFSDLLKSHYDSYRLIINSCSNKLLAFHHLTTLDHVEFNNPIIQLIKYMMKEVPFCGLYFGILTSSFLSKILGLLNQLQPSVSHIEIINHLNKLNTIVHQVLDQVKKKEVLDGLRLISIVESALKILPLEGSFKKKLAISVVKASLLVTESSSNKMGHIQIKAIDGKDNCEVYNGVLYKLDSLWERKIIGISELCILLFTESLYVTSNSKNSNISKSEFIDCLIASKIQIVACQKSVEKKLLFLFRRHGIIVLERLGEETANALVQLSGAFPISDQSQINLEDIYKYVGVISRLEYISVLNETYLILESDENKVVTLFITHRSFDALDQLKAVLKECIHTLHSIFQYPWFLPGNFDGCLIKTLNNFQDSDKTFKQIITLFASAIEETSPSSNNDIYLIKANSLSQTLLAISNIFQIGLFIVKD